MTAKTLEAYKGQLVRGRKGDLHDAERKLTYYLDAERNRLNKLAGAKDLMCDGQGEAAARKSRNGIAGEMILARWFNVTFDVTTGAANGCDGKCTETADGCLMVAQHKAHYPIDFYALVTGRFPGPYIYRGCFPHKLLCVPERLEQLHPDKPAGYVAYQPELMELGDVFLYLTADCEIPPLRR
jgi:hypothetical protein